VLITRLSLADVRECSHVAGLDVHAKGTPPNESSAGFAAACAAYAFDNHAHAPSARFIASRGNGAGYDSGEAVARRREAVERREDARNGEPSAPGDPGSVETNNGSVHASTVEGGPNDRPDGFAYAGTDTRAPPIECDGRTCGTPSEYERAVRRVLMRRIGKAVHVCGVGTAKLLKVYAGEAADAYVRTEVHVDGEDVTRRVSWSDLSARNEPRIRTSRPRSPRTRTAHADMTEEKNTERTGTGLNSSDPVERFNAAATTSRVTVELPDGRRRVTVKNHETGEVVEKVLPPRG